MSWKSTYANRGTHLEELVRRSCIQYQDRGIARIDKVATPVKILEIKNAGKVTGFIEKKSTVDYVGVVRGGGSIAFDCKETRLASLPFGNIEQHQIDYLQDIQRLGGVSFLIVYFDRSKRYYRLDFETLIRFWNDSKNGGRKSIPEPEFKTEIRQEERFLLHFLKGLI